MDRSLTYFDDVAAIKVSLHLMQKQRRAFPGQIVTIPHRGLRPTNLRLSRAEAHSTIQPRPVIQYALPVPTTMGWDVRTPPKCLAAHLR